MRNNFGLTPQVRFNRSRFDLSHGIKTSFNIGQLVPLDWQEIVPGDTFKGTLKGVARVSTSFLKPVMDNLFMDIHHFFIPYRLVCDYSERVFGNPNPSAYTDNDLLSFPTNLQSCEIVKGSVGDYLGLPLGKYAPNTISLLPFRAFALCYNIWFRNENIVDETYVQTGEAKPSETPNSDPWSPNNYTGMLPKVSRRKDYFSTCLLAPQKGAPVQVPIATGDIPVSSGFVSGNLYEKTMPFSVARSSSGNGGWDISMNPIDGTTSNLIANGSNDGIYNTFIKLYNDDNYPLLRVSGQTADIEQANFANVNDLRYAFALQKMLERDALYGSRYNEYLLGHFGVSSPDARLQLPEYLGGGRIPIQIYQTVQTSSTSDNSPLGNVAGFSVSEGYSKFSKGFVEHGICLTVASVRQFHTYQQGLPKKWFKFERNDFYDPLFATIGEQPVYSSELYHSDNELPKSSVFGYNEAFADYRSLPNIVTGEMRSNIENSLDIWHFADYYNNKPYLTKDFIEETDIFVNRTLEVPSNSQDTFITDFWFDLPAIRVMPTYSVPGLIDHH